MKITGLLSRYILDSRGYPTVEVDLWLKNGGAGRASVPSGASTGSREALELRDGGDAFSGKGVEKALYNIDKTIRPLVLGKEFSSQAELDSLLIETDGSDDKSQLGANAMLAVSLAYAKALAAAAELPLFWHLAKQTGNRNLSLPMPMVNVLNGGKHASGSTDIQEFMIVPVGAKDFPAALRMAGETFHSLASVLKEKGYGTSVGDEGGYAPALSGGSDEAIDLLRAATEKAGYSWGDDIALALDVAASELYNHGTYDFEREGRQYDSAKLIEYYRQLADTQPLVSLEDGLDENDWAGWQQLTEELGDKIQLVGDDLLVTNPQIIEQAVENKAANTVLIKPNQIGTLTETIQAVQSAQNAGWRTIMSHRSGETEDTTIAHLAVGLNCGQIKTGSMSRSERLAKYNELLRINEQIPKASLNNPFK